MRKIVFLLFLSLTVVLIGCGGSNGPGINTNTNAGTTTYTVGGTVTGLIAGKSITLQNNGGDDLAITQDGSFVFSTSLNDGDAYAVTISTQPSGGNCTISNDTGTISASNISNVTVICSFSGYLDVAFGNNGIVQVNDPTGSSSLPSEYAEDVAVDSQGRIVVVGYIYNGTDSDMAIWRFNSDGTPDTSFGQNGFVSHNNAAGGNYNDYAMAVVIDGNDNIYVTGSSYGSNLDSNGNETYDMVIWKFTSSGTLDTGFNGRGIVVSDLTIKGVSLGWERGYDITLDSQGRIVVVGYAPGINSSDVAVWRYNADGTSDTTFGSSIFQSGLETIDSIAGGSGVDEARAVALDSSDNIYITGYSEVNSLNKDLFILKLSAADGSLDTGFNSTGIVTYDDNGRLDYGLGILVTSNNVYAAGYNSSNPFVLKYDLTGAIDTTYGTNGVANPAPNATSTVYLFDMVMDSSGSVLVSGMDFGDSVLSVWRLDNTGQPDANFGSSARAVVLQYSNVSSSSLEALTLDSQGGIITVGYYYVDSTNLVDMIVARINP